MKKTPGETRRDEAEVNALIEENLRLVQKIANDFLGRGLSWDDLVSEGNRGLVTAARRFDPSRGARFSTYSSWWIKQAIRQAISEQGRTVRVPIGTELNWRKVRRSTRKLAEELGRKLGCRVIRLDYAPYWFGAGLLFEKLLTKPEKS